MSERFDVKLNPQLRKYTKKAIANPQVKELLAFYNLKETEQGVARLAVILFLRDIGISPEPNLHRHIDRKKT